MKRLLPFFWCLILWPQIVWGHAALVATSLTPGAVLAQAPAEISLAFNEAITVTQVQLIDPSGARLATHVIQDAPAEIRIPVPADPATGTYLLSWRVVSADGHPVGGALDYAIGTPSAQGLAQDTGTSTARDDLIWLARWLGYLCLFVASGAALFRLLNPTDMQGWARPFVKLGIALLPVSLALQGLDLRGAPWSGLVGLDVWQTALDSRYAWTLGLMLLALLAASQAIGRPAGPLQRLMAAASPLLAAVSLAASGHASTASPQWLARPAVAVHGLMAIAWLGTLVPLMRSLREPSARHTAAQHLLDRPSAIMPLACYARWIPSVVMLLIGTGLVLAGLQLDQPGDLWHTAYGRVLLAKLVLVVLLLSIAARNRWRLTQASLGGTPGARQSLVRSIALEALIAVVLLAVLSLWRFTPPPRSLDAGLGLVRTATQNLGFPETLENRQVRATLSPNSGNIWSIRLQTPDKAAFPAQAVTLVLTNPAEGIEALTRPARPLSGGLWRVSLPTLPTAGHWQVALDILVNDFDQITLDGPAPPAAPAPASTTH
ncbi:copper resistance protein CopC [Castellaniella caeni]